MVESPDIIRLGEDSGAPPADRPSAGSAACSVVLNAASAVAVASAPASSRVTSPEEGFGFGTGGEAADGVRAVRDVIAVVRDRIG
ncbi:hypothetical protein AB0E81_19320 [Streptomyces sp. NPDC033538]|uniref:hypothetical protein n=1 Tax=Streptomyces sp. NPDC033538 TaxID=3155367 RepID=UPI0034060D6B